MKDRELTVLLTRDFMRTSKKGMPAAVKAAREFIDRVDETLKAVDAKEPPPKPVVVGPGSLSQRPSPWDKAGGGLR